MFILNFLLTASCCSVIVTAYLVPGFEFDSFITAAIAVLILGLFNRW